jgi:hypothetical protein
MDLATQQAVWPNGSVLGKTKKVRSDEIGVAGLTIGLIVLIPGALLLGFVPFLSALNRLGTAGTAILIVAIIAGSVAFFWAYERWKASSPPTPRRDLVLIVFSALVIGLWVFAFSNEAVAGVVLAAAGAVLLLPDGWLQSLTDRLPW